MKEEYRDNRVQKPGMTAGNETKVILSFMIPLLLGNLFQQVYTLVDSLVVGRFVGTVALGSVGSVGSIQFLLLSLCIGLAGGVNVLIAQLAGAEQEEKVKHAIGNSIYVTLGSGFLISVIAILFAEPILHLMKVPDANFSDALVYMRIVCGGTIVTAVYNTASQILRALGDSKTPFYMIVVSSIVNVILDLIFVLCFHMGVAGVAWATVIAQIISAAGSVLLPLRSNPYFHLSKRHLAVSGNMIRKIMWMGIPLAMQNAMASISGVITQGIVNSFGSTVMAAYTAGSKAEQIFSQPYSSLGVAVANFSGQNIGAGKTERVERACRKMVIITEVFTVILIAVCFLFQKQIIGLFVEDIDVIEIGASGLMLIAISYLATGLVYIFKAMLNGAGDTMFTLVSGIFEIAVRIVVLFTLVSVPKIGSMGIWLAAIPAGIFSAVLCIRRYQKGGWKIKKV